MRVLLIVILFLVGTSAVAQTASQTIPEPPKIQTQKKTDSAAESKQNGEQQKDSSAEIAPSIPVSPSYALNKETTANSDKSGEEAERGSEFWPWIVYGRKVKITDSLLALFTFALIIVGGCQNRQLRKSIELSREEFNATHRPSLMLRYAYVRDDPVKGTPVKARINIANTGENAAHVIASILEIKFVNQTDQMILPIEGFSKNDVFESTPVIRVLNADENKKNVIAGGASRTFDFVSELIWSDETMPHFINGFGLWLYGKIVYKDSTGIQRITAFRRYYDPRTRYFSVVADGDMTHDYID